uniref:ATP binding cassette subfamily A member 13 n=1 Tax=Cyanistes caeruleus TaxID=156563 RepID=A0A8C0UZD2_CYACU
MGHAVHQFKALFWKNWLCRVRQPVLSLTEILWPCVLFLILAAIRFQEPPKYKENCYLEARDLPSRGLYPFMQTLFCNVGSRCRNTSYTTQRHSRFRGPERATASDLDFMEEIEELAKEFIVTTEKAMALEKLWEENSRMDLNEAEKIISRAENLYKQPYFWNLLHSLPHLEMNSFYTEDELVDWCSGAHILLPPENLGTWYLDLNKCEPPRNSFQYNLSLGDVLSNLLAVKAELESRFGFDGPRVEKLLSYTAQLTAIPTGETLEQFVCSALAFVPEDEANEKHNGEGCNSAQHEAKLYLVSEVSKFKLYAQILDQWLGSSSLSQNLLLELRRIMADLMSQFLDDKEVRKLFSEINTLIQQWNEKSDAYFSEGYVSSHDWQVILTFPILTSFKAFLKTEENLRISGEKKRVHLFHLVEVIEKIMFDFSFSKNKSLIENALNNAITWIKNFTEGEESATNFSLAVSELYNELQKDFQPLQSFWTKKRAELFWHTIEIVFHELDSRVSLLSQVEEEELIETLCRILSSITENKIFNRSMALLKNTLTDWPELNITALDHLKHLSGHFQINLCEVRSLSGDHVNVSFSTIPGVSNTSLFLSNATFMYKVQELGEIVHDFLRNIQNLNDTSVASFVPNIFSLYQNYDLILDIKSNNTLLKLLYETSKSMSSSQVWHDLQNKEIVFDFLFETFNLLWNLTSKSLCEKLLLIYNYTVFQAEFLVQNGKEDIQVVYDTLSSLKTLFIDEELQTAALCYLEEFFDLSPECLVNNVCADFYLENMSSEQHSAEIYNLFLLPLNSVLSNVINWGDKISVPSALHCTFTWLQTWTEIFEEASEILNLNSTCFVCLRDDLTYLSENILNITQDELCNNTAMAIVEATGTAMKLLKFLFQEHGNLNDLKDFEAFLVNLQRVINNAFDVTNLLKDRSLESVLETMGVAITKMQKSILKIVNEEFLNLWLDAFISGGSEGEDKGVSVFSIGNSLSTVLKLSQKELEIMVTEINDTSAFLKSVLQDKYVVCISIFQNITKLILDNTLKDVGYLQTNFSSHLNFFLNFHSTMDEAEDCNTWIHGLSNLIEKYKSPSHLESAKHILILLQSLGNAETDAKLMNVMDFVKFVFNLILPECSLGGSDVICVSVYFNIIAKTLKFILPEFYVKDVINVLELIFRLLNNSGEQIQTIVSDLFGSSLYMSNKTHFSQSTRGFNRTSRMLLNPFHHIHLISAELLLEIQSLLKNETFEVQENSSSHLDKEIEPFLHGKNISLLMEFFQYMIRKLDSNLQNEHKTFPQKLIETAGLNIELVRKVLEIFKTPTFTVFPLRDEKEFLKHMVALVQNVRKMDVEFLISRFKQVQENLENLFKNIKYFSLANSELGTLIDWWDILENVSCYWNLTAVQQITQLFEQDELYNTEDVFNILFDVISLTERLAHGNITEALTEIYAFIVTQEEKMPLFTDEEFSTQIDSLLTLLETLADISDESGEASVCFSAAFCWTLTTATPQNDPTVKPCDFVHTNSTLHYNSVIQIIKELKLITLDDSFACFMEDIQMDITRNLTCFFHQIKEWNSIILKFSELHHTNSSVLKELLDFWNKLSLYAVPLQVNNTHAINCSSTPKSRMALQIIETLDSILASDVEMAKSLLEQLDNLYGGLTWNRESRTSFESVLTNVKDMTSEVSRLLNTEAVLSFLSVIQPLMSLSSIGNQTHSMLMTISALSGSINIANNFENLWFPVVSSKENLLVNFSVRHLLVVIDQEFQLLKFATGQSSSVASDVLLEQFKTSSVDAISRNFEDIQDMVKSVLCDCNNKNYSKIMHTLILLMTNESSSNDLLLAVKDVIAFLELFQNKSKKDYTGILFGDSHFSRAKLNNTHAAFSVLPNSLLHIIADIDLVEEAMLLFFPLPDVKIKDFVQNITQLRLDIGSSVNISEETVNTLLEVRVSYSEVLYSAFAVALTGRCDEEVLSLVLKLPENNRTSLVVEELCSLSALDFYTMFVLIIQNFNVRHIIYKVQIPPEIGNILNMLLDVVSSISSLLNKVHHVMEKLPVFLQGIQNTVGFQSSAVGSLESVIKAVCKEESSFFSNANLFIDMPRTMELLEDNMAKYGIPEDSTPFCLKLYQEILQAPNGALLWTFLKPLLHGKILYNSKISMIDLVMEKVSIKKMPLFLCIDFVFVISFKVLKNNFVKHFIESNLDINMEKLLKKMQAYGTYMKVHAMLVVNVSSCVLLDRFQPFDSIEKLEEKAYELMQENNLLASIIFNTPEDKKQDSSNLLPRRISYTIRTSVLYSMRTDLIKNPTWKSHPHKLPADGFKYNHVFIPLQDMIEGAIISAQTGINTPETAIQVQAMPYPCHTSDLFLNNIGFFFPLMMMLTWVVSVAAMVRKLVFEREINLEEYMKTMGVYPVIHFFAWFLENVIVLTVSSCALAIILKASGIFVYSNGFLIFLFLLEFGVTIIMLSYFLGAFFSSANTAALCSSLVYMTSFLPYIVLLVLQNQLSFTNQITMCLLSTTAFGQGIFFITHFEGQEIGIQWDNVHQSMAQGGYMTFGWTCWMMFFDSILYFVGGWYFSNIIPGKFGLKNQWYFPFTVSYWKNLCGTERSKRHYLNSNMFFFNENFQEKEVSGGGPGIPCTEGGTIGVVLLSLTKEHVDGQKAAVKDLNLTFHKGQITALLGPNGAGKSTVISLLTGLYPPSSGTIIVDGKDIRTELAAIRTELGVCLQYDVLFNTLTVREHLLLYGSVKAPRWTKEQLNEQVTLEDVGLSQHQHEPVGTLSGGMKRRLSVAISFIGNSKTVVLDEPTTGVDPCSRRSIWDVILKYKAGCTLIFTTHHLDEAEVLSDHIAILQHGHLRCCGSPSCLRETYGQGHSLTFIKKPSVFEIKDTAQVTSLVQNYIPEAFLKENSGTELTYVIPERADKTAFKGLFQALDQSLQYLHVTGYGISDTTLEEVLVIFLAKKLLYFIFDNVVHESSIWFSLFVKRLFSLSHLGISLAGASSVHGAHLVLTQIVALLMKRFHHTRRDWRGSLSSVLLPVLFVALSMALFSVKPLAIDYPSLKLTPRLYNNAESFFSATVFKKCFTYFMYTFFQICPSFNTSAPYVKNKKGHILYNLSGFPVEEYLVWYNQKGFHSLPSYLNELNNLILWLNLPSNVDWRQYGITLYSQPYGGALLDEDKIMENVRQCGVALCIMLGFSILTASIGTAIVKDRVSGMKRLQHITGLGYKTYWLGNFCYDMVFYMVPVTLCIGIISAFQLSAFTFQKNLAATVLLLILYGYATLPWMYLASRFFSSSDVAFISYISLNFVFGLCTMLVTLLPRLLAIISKVQSFQSIYNILKWAFIIFPQFCLGQGLIELSYNQIKFDLTRNFGIDSYVSPFEMDFLGWIFVEMSLQGTLLLLLRLFLHWDLLWKTRGHCSVNSMDGMESPSEDADVEMERQRLFSGRTGNDVLLLYNLRKCYGGFSKKNTAVENISLGISRGECFGLLGTNGAGKSTTFKMLTGDIIPSAGRAVIRTPTGSEIDILSASSESIIGYCPQQDALDELLTGWEHLYYYCTLRGIPKQDIHKVAEDLVNRLHLNAHADKLVRTYSAGTKRKLSTAVALVGKPQILLLDEPSSGMDPCSKRYFWKAVLKEVQDGCAAVLTSHSMEECEALCTRLAIMVNGVFKCLGSPQHIKNRFGDGYSVKVWLSKEISYGRMILDCLQLHFPGTQFKGQHLNLLEYHVPRSQGCLAELFRVLENHKAFLQTKHYSISQSTLEQVFYTFCLFSSFCLNVLCIVVIDVVEYSIICWVI